VTYLPSYLIHDEDKKATIEEVINAKYAKQLNEKKRKKRPSKMEKYLNNIDKEKIEAAQPQKTNTEPQKTDIEPEKTNTEQIIESK